MVALMQHPFTPEQALNHDGTPNAPDDRYPVGPPAEIGRLVSATTYVTHAGLKPTLFDSAKRVTQLALLCAVIGLLVPGLILGVITFAMTQQAALFPLVAVAVGAASFFASKPMMKKMLERSTPVCSFIGSEGIKLICNKPEHHADGTAEYAFGVAAVNAWQRHRAS